MKLACLGWGSLVWDPRGLPVVGPWFEDGPFMPVEFTRKSNDGRITLVCDDQAAPLRVLWAQMQVPDLHAARLALRDREGINAEQWEHLVPAWISGEDDPKGFLGISAWAHSVGLEGVVWTGLGHKFNDNTGRPTVGEIISYLDGLRRPVRVKAEQYVRRTPTQIDTEYRREMEARLGWTPC